MVEFTKQIRMSILPASNTTVLIVYGTLWLSCFIFFVIIFIMNGATLLTYYINFLAPSIAITGFPEEVLFFLHAFLGEGGRP